MMLTVILGCIIANILFTSIIGYVIYRRYKKNEDKIEAKVEEVKATISTIKEGIETATASVETISTSIDSVVSTVEDIKKALDKLPFNA